MAYHIVVMLSLLTGSARHGKLRELEITASKSVKVLFIVKSSLRWGLFYCGVLGHLPDFHNG